ncbi:unnamed protein product, partial [Symbiodinium sp. KB8]
MSSRDATTTDSKENIDPDETQAIRSFRKLREFLAVYMFQAWCDAYVTNVAYNDMCEATNADPAATEIPSEEAMHQLASDTVGHELARRAFDYGVFELLWPRRDTSTLDDMTRLVLTFAALRVR